MECAIDPNNPDVMYSTVYYGALSKSTNGGGNFNDIAPANDGAWVTPFVLDPSNSNRIIAGYTEVWESLDGGDNWSTLTNGQAGGEIDAIAVSKSDGNVIYFSEYNELYLTTDNGANWSLVSNGLPNRSISYISIDPLNPKKLGFLIQDTEMVKKYIKPMTLALTGRIYQQAYQIFPQTV